MKIKSLLKLSIINTAVLSAVLITPLIIYDFKKLVRIPTSQGVDKRHSSPAYKEGDMSYDFFRNKDILKGKYSYKSYIGWRPPAYTSKTLTIKPEFGTRMSIGEEINNSFWFFGGSTMWGFGAKDSKTIPSIYSSITNHKVFNFGEQSWTSRQSLNQLIAALDAGKIPKHVVFYDGWNDPVTQCGRTSFPIHARQEQIANSIAKYPGKASLLTEIVERYRALAIEVRSKFSKSLESNSRSCLESRNYGYSIARSLVNSWYTAFLLSRSVGSGFTAILQPHIYTSDQSHSYIQDYKDNNEEEMLRIFYSDVKRLVKEKCYLDKNFCQSFYDGSGWIKGDDIVFIDQVHLTPKGNEIIADRIAAIVKSQP